MRDASRNRLALEIVRCTLFLLCLVMASAFTTPIGNLFVFCTQTHGFFGCRYQYDIFRMPQDGKHDGHVLRTRRRYRGVFRHKTHLGQNLTICSGQKGQRQTRVSKCSGVPINAVYPLKHACKSVCPVRESLSCSLPP